MECPISLLWDAGSAACCRCNFGFQLCRASVVSKKAKLSAGLPLPLTTSNVAHPCSQGGRKSRTHTRARAAAAAEPSTRGNHYEHTRARPPLHFLSRYRLEKICTSRRFASFFMNLTPPRAACQRDASTQAITAQEPSPATHDDDV